MEHPFPGHRLWAWTCPCGARCWLTDNPWELCFVAYHGAGEARRAWSYWDLAVARAWDLRPLVQAWVAEVHAHEGYDGPATVPGLGDAGG